jgi:GT2 family glycosyltransferase
VLVTYMIASRNRREELLRTLLSCREQLYPDKEILVVDDASADGTYDAVRRDFPEAILMRNGVPIGSIASRNLMLGQARGDVLVGFDDDSRFIDIASTATVVERFQREPDLGLVDCQDIGPEHPERIGEGPGRLKGEWHTPSFGAGRYAMRRAVLDKTGFYAPFFWHSYEEPDLAIRIWDAGYRCLQWNDILVWHEFSNANRDEKRTHSLHARNELLSIWMRAPRRYVLALTAWRMASQLRYSLRRGWWADEPRIWWEAARKLRLALRYRRPVKGATYRRCVMLSRRRVSDPRGAWALGR